MAHSQDAKLRIKAHPRSRCSISFPLPVALLLHPHNTIPTNRTPALPCSLPHRLLQLPPSPSGFFLVDPANVQSVQDNVSSQLIPLAAGVLAVSPPPRELLPTSRHTHDGPGTPSKVDHIATKSACHAWRGGGVLKSSSDAISFRNDQPLMERKN